MRLRDYFDPELIKLKLDSTSRDEVIKELVSMLALDEESEARFYKTPEEFLQPIDAKDISRS